MAYRTKMVAVRDCRGVPSLDVYEVPSHVSNPQDAVHYRRVAYWDQDGDYGEWIYAGSGEPTGWTNKSKFKYIGRAN